MLASLTTTIVAGLLFLTVAQPASAALILGPTGVEYVK